MTLCIKCRRNPRVKGRRVCQKCINKSKRLLYATDKEFRERESKRNINYQRKKIKNDPSFRKHKREYTAYWRSKHNDRYIFLQARSAFNRLSPYYRKKFLKEFNLHLNIL